MKEKDKGPVKILCDEIGAHYSPRMESTAVLTAFIGVLVNAVGDMMATASVISDLTGKEVSEDAAQAHLRAKRITGISDKSTLMLEAGAWHEKYPSYDESPCDHYIDMLSSCMSGLRFGLEVPCKSRHAAAAADHVWKRRYGVILFDKHSHQWRKDWSKAMFYEALATLTPGTNANTGDE